MFTGRLPHELDVKWMTPLSRKFPTLAEYLGSHGYATAGFIANTQYCSSDTGLDRGFTHYEDYVADLPHLRPLRFALLFEHAWTGISDLGCSWAERLPAGRFTTRSSPCSSWLLGSDRKDAAEDQSRIPRLVRPTVESRGVPSSHSSITSMPMHPTSSPRERRSALAWGPGPWTISRCW